MNESPLIRVVDDDESVRAALTYMLQMEGLDVVTYDSADAFLRDERESRIGVLILDVKMPGKTGLQLHEELIARRYPRPIVFLSGHGDIGMAVTAVKKGAVNFLQKPINPSELMGVIRECLKAQAEGQKMTQTEVETIIRTLTPREKEIVGFLLTGLSNADIAQRLNLSIRTVEHHRESAYRKMGVHSQKELETAASGFENLFRN